jgi:hypothetical protein
VTAQITRNNHVVPRCICKNFVDGQGYLHGFLKRENRYVRRAPRRMFVEVDYYTQFDPNGLPLDRVERDLQRLESVAGPILKQIVERARAKQFP